MAITARELMEELNADPEWVARRKRQDEEHARRAEELREAEEPLIEALRAMGYEVASAWNLPGLPNPYTDALPLLLDHLQRPYPPNVRAGIARALMVPEVAFAWDLILELYRGEKSDWVKQGLANILSVIGRRRVDEILELLRDESLGSSRVLLLTVIDKSKDSRSDALLEEMTSDPQLAKEAAHLIKKRAKNRERREERRRAKEFKPAE